MNLLFLLVCLGRGSGRGGLCFFFLFFFGYDMRLGRGGGGAAAVVEWREGFNPLPSGRSCHSRQQKHDPFL